jgi:hypothetical protein
MDIEDLADEIEVRGYDSPALAFEDKLARKRAKQLRLLRSLENLARNMEGTTQALRDFSNLVKKKCNPTIEYSKKLCDEAGVLCEESRIAVAHAKVVVAQSVGLLTRGRRNRK